MSRLSKWEALIALLGFIGKEEADLIQQEDVSLGRWSRDFNRSQIAPTDAQRALASERLERWSERFPTDGRRWIADVLRR
jgi:hypothetical protein